MLNNFRASKIRKSKYYLENMLKQEEILNKPKRLHITKKDKIGIFKKVINWFRWS
jgi:hypothetical protein